MIFKASEHKSCNTIVGVVGKNITFCFFLLPLFFLLSGPVRAEEKAKPQKQAAESKSTPPKSSDTPPVRTRKKLNYSLLVANYRDPVEPFTDFPLKRPTKLGKRKQARIRRAEKKFRKIVGRGRRFVRESSTKYEKGDPELRLCTFNLDNYANANDYARIIRKKKKKLRKKERKIIAALQQSMCDIIALQGIVAKDRVSAISTIERLIKKLSKKDNKTWNFELSISNHEKTFHAFLFSHPSLELKSVVHHHNTPLSSNSEHNTFSRGPFEVVLKFKDPDKKRRKKIKLVTMLLQQSYEYADRLEERKRIRETEALRTILYKYYKEVAQDPKERTIVVLLGDRGGSKRTAATQVLEGRLLERDLLSQRCSLEKVKTIRAKKTMDGDDEQEEIEESDEKKKKKRRRRKEPLTLKEENDIIAVCESKRPKMLFGVTELRAKPKERFIKKKVDDEMKTFRVTKKKKRTKESREEELYEVLRSSEIYMFARHLRYVEKTEDIVGRYTSGTTRVELYPPQSPLVWTDLNW